LSSLATTPGRLRVLLRDTAMVLVFNTVVATILMMVALAARPPDASAELRNRILASHMIYSQAIGLTIFSLIELPRLTRWWQRPPGLPSLSLVVATAIAVGYLLGQAIASWITESEFQPLIDNGPFLIFIGMLTVLTSLLAVHFITNRERLSQEKLRAETSDVRARNAQLQLLQQQIEPHMLFNTLANIHALTETEPARAQVLIESLSELLHASMQLNLQQQVTLAQEFALLGHYLQVVSVRMGGRLSYSMSLPADLEHIMVPPLLVQPLVENAIKHGLDDRASGGAIHVVARGGEQQLIVEVIDDGVGLRNEDPFVSSRIGLSNVRRRLELAFGERSDLHLSENPPHGVRARLTIPL
jgi:sensor histidine kinase YesM